MINPIIMATSEKTVLSASVEVNSSIEKVWELWTAPQHIMIWNICSSDWHNLKVENNPRAGGRFLFAMALKDGSFGFDFAGVYDEVIPGELIAYTVDDGRKTRVTFAGSNPVILTEIFDAASHPAPVVQQDFCQAVLNNFKRYAEE